VISQVQPLELEQPATGRAVLQPERPAETKQIQISKQGLKKKKNNSNNTSPLVRQHPVEGATAALAHPMSVASWLPLRCVDPTRDGF
jgi:hypothetical protein